jgi:phage gp36-like protein
MSYATPADLLARYNLQVIGQLASDTSTALTALQILTDPNVQAALDDAAGVIDGALLRGQRYSVVDLTTLTGNSLALLKRINCDGAFINLWKRKSWDGQEERLDRAMEDFEKMLRKLATGEEIFNVPSDIEAGVPEITGPTSVEYEQLNTIASRCRGHIYPMARLPNDR